MSVSTQDTNGAQHQPTDSSSLLPPPGIMAMTNLEAQKKGEYQRGVEGWAEFRREWDAVTKELKERLRKCRRSI